MYRAKDKYNKSDKLVFRQKGPFYIRIRDTSIFEQLERLYSYLLKELDGTKIDSTFAYYLLKKIEYPFRTLKEELAPSPAPIDDDNNVNKPNVSANANLEDKDPTYAY